MIGEALDFADTVTAVIGGPPGLNLSGTAFLTRRRLSGALALLAVALALAFSCSPRIMLDSANPNNATSKGNFQSVPITLAEDAIDGDQTVKLSSTDKVLREYGIMVGSDVTLGDENILKITKVDRMEGGRTYVTFGTKLPRSYGRGIALQVPAGDSADTVKTLEETIVRVQDALKPCALKWTGHHVDPEWVPAAIPTQNRHAPDVGLITAEASRHYKMVVGHITEDTELTISYRMHDPLVNRVGEIVATAMIPYITHASANERVADKKANLTQSKQAYKKQQADAEAAIAAIVAVR